MKKILLAALLLGITASLALAQTKPCRPLKHARVPPIKGLTYHKARKLLLTARWQPSQTKSSAEAETDPDISNGNGLLFWQKGYVEVEACAGTGHAPCIFLFKDAYGNRLRVYTEGEELPEAKAEAGVTDVRFVCQEP